jgi:DNA polymerase-3 subunit delta'
VVDPEGKLPLPWLAAALDEALRTQRGHALLIHGPQGIGQFELGLTLAQSWLCEAAPVGQLQAACGRCASCHLVQARSHPDLLVLLPEALRESLGWDAAEEGGDSEAKASKAKPSKELKVEAIRGAVNFAQTTSARGRAKVVLLHPAERMNGISANTLLKTLEEPPGQARFILSSGSPDALLPTIRSRCQALPLALPPTELATRWLAEHKVAQPDVLLAAAGGQPLQALEWAQDGVDAVAWLRLPKQLAAGDAGQLGAWPLPRLLEAMHKLCHDALCLACGAPPRYFPPASLPAAMPLYGLTRWASALSTASRHGEHPWNQPVMVESLVQQAREALAPARHVKGPSVHSAR